MSRVSHSTIHKLRCNNWEGGREGEKRDDDDANLYMFCVISVRYHLGLHIAIMLY